MVIASRALANGSVSFCNRELETSSERTSCDRSGGATLRRPLIRLSGTTFLLEVVGRCGYGGVAQTRSSREGSVQRSPVSTKEGVAQMVSQKVNVDNFPRAESDHMFAA